MLDVIGEHAEEDVGAEGHRWLARSRSKASAQGRRRSQACQNARDRCVQECDRTRDRALSENQLRRTQINFELQRDLLDCSISNSGNQAAIVQCQNDKITAAELELAGFDVSDRAIGNVRLQCVTECDNQARECDKNILPKFQGSAGIDLPTEVGCLEGGRAMLQEGARDLHGNLRTV